MHKIFESLTADLRKFVTQRDNLLLLVPCGDDAVGLLLKALRDLDRESGGDLYLLFADNFESAGQFVDSIASRMGEEHTLTNEAVDLSVPKLPPLPDALTNEGLAAADRLQEGLRYARSLIDPRMGQHFVWGLGPGRIDNFEQYAALLTRMLPAPDIRPWMRGARLVARVPSDFALDLSPFAASRHIQVRPLVIPPNAQEEELLAAVADPKTSPGDRMQAEVQLGYLDCAYGRFDQAIARFLKTLAFYQWAGIPALECLVICGLGDVARRREEWQDAQYWYECAVVPGAKSGNPMLMATVVQHLAAIAFRDERFADGEQRYSELVTLKRAMMEEDGLAEALQWQGLCQEKQQAYDRAILSWEEAALLSKAFELPDRLEPLLADLRRGYQALHMQEELESFDADWAAEIPEGLTA